MDFYGLGELQTRLEATLTDVERTMKLFTDIETIVGPLNGEFAGYKQTLRELHDSCSRRLQEINADHKPNRTK